MTKSLERSASFDSTPLVPRKPDREADGPASSEGGEALAPSAAGLILPPVTMTKLAAAGASTVDFRQGANNETNGTVTGLGNVHWINSIVQQSNSVYFEGMSVPERLIL